LLLRRWNQRRTPFTSVPLPPIYIYIYIKYWWFPFLLLQPPTSQHSSLSPPIFSLGLPSIHKKPLVLSLLGWSLSLSLYIYIYIYICTCAWCVWVFFLSHLCMKHGLGDACGGEGEKHAPSLVWLATL
jgi:hypothetical protein